MCDSCFWFNKIKSKIYLAFWPRRFDFGYVVRYKKKLLEDVTEKESEFYSNWYTNTNWIKIMMNNNIFLWLLFLSIALAIFDICNYYCFDVNKMN